MIIKACPSSSEDDSSKSDSVGNVSPDSSASSSSSKSNIPDWIYGDWKCNTDYGTIAIHIDKDGITEDFGGDVQHGTYTVDNGILNAHFFNGIVTPHELDMANHRLGLGEGLYAVKVGGDSYSSKSQDMGEMEQKDIDILLQMGKVHDKIKSMAPSIDLSYDKLKQAEMSGDRAGIMRAMRELEDQRQQSMLYWDEYISLAGKLEDGGRKHIIEARQKAEEMHSAFEKMMGK